ncbi:hypothetical protein XELAEV_18039612mg [Xenopus laevis]|uniref:ATP-dependent RNA helicase FANCM n=1 Tax=Xenopus laevis TaxID=8355 RepID=A0A974H841_XENLA|nr:hypothetical protein XELAEV_18039612mg [Xenopus laevis]
MSGKQKTLFQTWGTNQPPEPRKTKEIKPRKGKTNGVGRGKQSVSRGVLHRPLVPVRQQPPTTCQEEEDDDDVMVVAVYEAEKTFNQTLQAEGLQRNDRHNAHSVQGKLWDELGKTSSPVVVDLPGTSCQLQGDQRGNTSNECRTLGSSKYLPTTHEHQDMESECQPKATSIDNLPGFDLAAGSLWIYPTNYPLRDYQFNISYTALLQNTLVCLPTGLGKTFIAAVVMYNFYRWYPSGKIVFMAPTKPLVAQQIEACFRVMGIPQGHMAEMTGSTQAQNRKNIWETHRVFFLTPQVMVNDLTRGACPALEIKCLVIDEAHKALGNHAYCQVVRELTNYTNQFRILALSATPGGDTKSVQQVVSNLLISQIELRSEDSSDIQPYSHARQLEKFVVPLGEELESVQKTYLQLLDTFAGRLIQNNVLSRRDIPNLTKYQIILSRDQFRKNPPANIIGAQQGVIEGDYALCISLYHGYELLLQMGTRSLYSYLHGIIDGSKGMTRARNELSRNGDFMELYKQLEKMFSDTKVAEGNGSLLFNSSLRADAKKPFLYSHPKLKKLEEVVVQHFKSWKNGDQNSSNQTPEGTRIMIFSSFRDSVQEIAEMLNHHHPTVRVMTFVGHSSAGKGVKGFTQKEQLEVVKRFREGGFNTLVSTCVGEEGLDIGEVDLIICFDAQKSPIRLVQRMGRTGRKRQGRIVVILCQGREERTYNQSQSNKRSIYKAILGNNKMLHLHPQSPRMVPEGLNPKVHKMFITQGNYEAKESIRPMNEDRRSSTKHRKSSLLSNASDTIKEEWELTHAEFDTWNRMYRLQESDGIMDVRLPKSQFEYFIDAEPSTERPSGNIRELSLTEWRVWQNQPFPTHSVDHSDRCKNFIDVMEMIELMRMEEGGCNYDLEMMSYLNKEDVDATITRANLNVSGNNTKVADKLTHRKRGKSCKTTTLPLVLEPDEDFMSSFKKNTKSRSTDFASEDSKIHVQGTEESGSTELEHVFCLGEDMPDKECLFSDICTKSNDSTSNAVTNNQSGSDHVLLSDSENAVAKSQINAAAKADSGYHSCNEEPSSILSNLFYTPQTFINHGVFAEFVDHKMCELKKMLSDIKIFLLHSPPPINELDCLDDYKEDSDFSHHSCRSGPVKEKREDLLLRPLTPIPVTINSREMQADSNYKKQLDHVADKLFREREKDDVLFRENLSQHIDAIKNKEHIDALKVDGEAAHSPDHNVRFEDASEPSTSKDLQDGRKENDDQWDEMFDYESQDKENENFASQVNMGDTEGSYAKNENHNINSVPSFLEDSFDLFEEDGFSDNADYGQFDLNHESKDKPPDDANTTVSFNMFDPSLLLQDQVQTEREPETNNDIRSENLEEELDCSEELFSVNFDLGFSIEDDELSESDSIIETPSKDFKVPNPLKRNDMTAIGCNAISTPVMSGKIHTTFSAVAEKQIQFFSPLEPVKGKFSLTPEKSLCSSSFLTPLEEKFKSPHMSSDNKHDCDLGRPQTSKAREQSIYSATNVSVHDGSAVQENRRQTPPSSEHSCIESSLESEDNIVFCRKRKLTKANVLMSPQTASSDCDFDSPIPNAKKRRHVLNTPGSSEEEEEKDFKSRHSTVQEKSAALSRKSYQDRAVALSKKRKRSKQTARHFLDEEAELSSEGAEFVSSDENVHSDNEQDTSLAEFLNDDTQLSQVLNDSEMQGVYLKSVRSPAFGGRFKMAPRKRKHNMSIFSQIPEQDESYMEDSFCVQEEEDDDDKANDLESSEEEVEINFDLLKDDSIIGGKKQYCTRRRLKLKEAQSRHPSDTQPAKKKTRLIIQDDSSEEETGATSKLKDTSHPQKTFPSSKPSLGNTSSRNQGAPTLIRNEYDLPLRDRCQARINIKASLSEELDFQAASKSSSSTKSRTSSGIVHSERKGEVSTGVVNFDLTLDSSVTNLSFPRTDEVSAPTPIRTTPCILADTREISSGPEVISYLRTALGVKVEVCSLAGCDYIVSNRLAVERKSQSEFANAANRNKLVDRIQHLQHLFDRVCVVIEKDRVKPGETSRIFQRTRYYDSTLSALISAGVQVLFSSSQAETASLLKELALLEQRKNTAIDVPTEVKGHKQEAMQFYLSIPNVSYITALNLCHHFDSVAQMANSSVQVISDRAHMSAQKAEELYRYVHYMFEEEMVPPENPTKRSRVS